jgi:hypothetical protein
MSNHSGVAASISAAVRGEFAPAVGARVYFYGPRGYRAGTIVSKGFKNGTWRIVDRKGDVHEVSGLGLLEAEAAESAFVGGGKGVVEDGPLAE